MVPGYFINSTTLTCIAPEISAGLDLVSVTVATDGEDISVPVRLNVMLSPVVIHMEPQLIIADEEVLFTVILNDAVEIQDYQLGCALGDAAGIIRHGPLLLGMTNVLHCSTTGISADNSVPDSAIFSLYALNTPFYQFTVAIRGSISIRKVFPLTGFASQATGYIVKSILHVLQILIHASG